MNESKHQNQTTEKQKRKKLITSALIRYDTHPSDSGITQC